MTVSHVINHAARGNLCQPNLVRTDRSMGIKEADVLSQFLLSKPFQNVGDHFAGLRNDQFFDTGCFKRARAIPLMAKSFDRKNPDFPIGKLLSIEAVNCDPSFTFTLRARVAHKEILLDFRNGYWGQGRLANFNFHISVLTVVRSSNPIVRRTGRCGNTPARVAPMQGVAA